MIYISLFIAYVAIISILGWWFNRPKPKKWHGVSSKIVSVSEWAAKHRTVSEPMFVFAGEESAKRFTSERIEPYLLRQIDMIQDRNVKKVVIRKPRVSFRECEFRGGKFLIKNESSGNLKDSDFYESDLGIPWKPTKGNLEEKFQEDFNKEFLHKALVDDVSRLDYMSRKIAADESQVEAWIDRWKSKHGDLSEDFNRKVNKFLESNKGKTS